MTMKTVSWDEIVRDKARTRKRDWDRIANGEATPEEIQRENSYIKDLPKYRITNWPQLAAAAEKRCRLRHIKID